MSRKNVISIDIGSCKTKIVVGRREEELVIVEKAILLDTPHGCVQDGRLLASNKEFELLRSSISQALSQNKVKIKDAAFTVQSTSVIRRELDMPRVKPNELSNMIRYEIEQYLPIDLNEYIIEHKVLEDKKDSTSDKMRVLIAAMPKDLAHEYINLANLLELEPKVLDINSNAITKLFWHRQELGKKVYEVDKTVALMDLGCNNINISIVAGGDFQFSRIIPFGGEEMAAAAAEAFDLSLEEAEKKIISEANIKESAEKESLNEILRSIVFRWSDDIQRVFQYYKTRNSSNKIDEIYLYGGLSSLPGIAEYFSENLSMPVYRVKSMSGVKLDMPNNKASIEVFLNAIGAIIRK